MILAHHLSSSWALAAAVLLSACAGTPRRERPNIVYILADDLGVGDLRCFHSEGKIATPNLDRLAGEGMRFHDAHSPSAVCSPTRYGVLTGRYAWRTRMKRGVLGGASPHLIEAGRATVASLLRGVGYDTAMIGKWHLGWDFAHDEGAGAKAEIDFSRDVTNGPDACGFDHYYGHCGSLDMPPYVYVEDGHITAAPDRVTKGTGQGFWREGPTGADFRHEEVLPNFVAHAVDAIDERAPGNAPFFLYLALPAPHTPILPTPEFQGTSGTNPYGDYVRQVDHHVGELLAALDRRGLRDDTIVVFTSDNGCSPQADFPALAALGHDPNAGFRGAKADIYEGGHRVPFIVRWPGHIDAGSASNEPLCLTDLFATVADLCDVDVAPEAGVDSFSTLPILLGESSDAPRRDAIVHHSINGSFAIRRGRWKLILCPGSGGWSAPRPKDAYRRAIDVGDLPLVQLYDLEADRAEAHNVEAEHPDLVRDLTAQLARYVADGRSTPGPPQSNTGKTEFRARDRR